MKNAFTNLEIEDLAAGGDGIGTLNGRVCFVPLSAPGDLLKVRVTASNPRYSRGNIEEIIRPSKWRRESPCVLFGRCGGCTWLHLEESVQLKAKKAILARSLGIDEIQFISSPKSLGYRTSVRLQADPPKRLGFYAAGTKAVQNTTHCPILAPKLDGVLPVLHKELLGFLTGRSEVRLVHGAAGAVAVCYVSDFLPPEFYRVAEQLVPDKIAGIIVSMEGYTTLVAGDADAEIEGVDGEPFLAPALSFRQANPDMNREMARTIENWISSGNFKRALELFAGAGNMTVLLGRHISRLDTGELDETAVKSARTNIMRRNISKVTMHQGEALDIYQKVGEKSDLVVLDPPRGGHLNLAREIAKGKHRAVLYVSCNPSTLKRDLDELGAAGYRITKAMGFDMFPQTSHMEAAVLCERDG